MAQINIPRLPQAPEKYDQSQMNQPDEYNKGQIDQMIQSLDLLIQLLNSSYTPETLRNEDEAFNWFIA